MRLLSAQVAEVVLSECFRYSPEVLRGHLFPREEVHAAVALPIPVVLALYWDKESKMKTQKMRFSCHSCAKGAECSLGELPCEVLKGWLTVSQWKGSGAVSHYNFCSFSCLKSWIDTQAPRVPEVFLESFNEGKK